MLAGTLACVNAFGTGVADDKLLHAYVEDMVRYYLGEEPLLRSVPTYDPAQPQMLEMILDRIDELVIKPRSGHGGYGVVDRAACARRGRAQGRRAAGRGARALRRAGDGHALAPPDRRRRRAGAPPRRPAAVRHRLRRGVGVVPGGLTRVAFDAGALVVNSSQNGGSKDTWVLA